MGSQGVGETCAEEAMRPGVVFSQHHHQGESGVSGLEAWLSSKGAAGAVFAGGAGVAVLSVAAGVARSSSRAVVGAVRKTVTSTLEVTSKDAAYPWVLHWLKSAPRGAPLRHVSVHTVAGAEFELVPAPGRHWVRYEGWPLLVERAREYGTVNATSGTPWERVTLTGPAFMGSPGPQLFERLLREARVQCEAARDANVTTVLTCWGTEWRPFGAPRPKRPLASVILAPGMSDAIRDDALEWAESADWYRRRGVPYRRGYLLHGPPGGGKTSFVLALAADLDLDVCLLSLSEDSLTDDRLAVALANVPPRCLVLLEDVDAAFVGRDESRSAGRGSSGSNLRSSLTLSGLLNALDGAAASEGRLLFMTTNYLERLDHALLRPGRVDVVHKIDYAQPRQAAAIFRSFFDLKPTDHRPTHFARHAIEATTHAAGRPPSMAELQAFLIARKRDPDAAARDAAGVADAATARAAPTSASATPTALPADHEPPVVRSRGPRVLTAHDVDKMVFNPQPGWEDRLGKIESPSS